MGAIKDLLDPETGERIGVQVLPGTVKEQEVPKKKKRSWGLPTISQLYGALWPTTWEHFLAPLILCGILMSIDDPKLSFFTSFLWGVSHSLYLDDRFPNLVRILVSSFIVSLIYFVTLALIRQYILKALLSYKGWLYVAPKSNSKVVMIWGLLVKFFSGRNPRLYSYQNCLPRMPVPPLKTTVKKLLESLKPVLEPEEYTAMEKEASVFVKQVGFFPQMILLFKSWWSPNYHTDWWEKYVYLMSRSPLPICSNYYVLDYHKFNPTKKRSARAAAFVNFINIFKEKVDTQTLEPIVLRDTIPLCMWQYKRFFNSARIPGKEIDQYTTNSSSQHVVVSVKGLLYKVSVVDGDGKKVNTMDLQDQFEWILNDAEMKSRNCSEMEKKIAALTGSERTQWANIRNEYFSSGVNKESITAIEDSIVYIVFDDRESEDLTERCRMAMHGDASSMWFDKTFQAVIYKDGRLALNFEHGWSDAPVPCHLAEYAQVLESNYTVYDQEGNCKPFWTNGIGEKQSFRRSKVLIMPKRLEWEMSYGLEQCVMGAHTFCLKNNEDLDLVYTKHDKFGKGFIKTTGNSPDAFIQMAFQLAYFKDSGGKFALTYEATITRFFLEGRTETVRSLTQEVQQFVLAMNDENVSREEKIRLMRAAANKHQNNYRDCMAGNGVDRHLFALYVVSKAKGYDTSFLSKAFALPWTLSTSCTPINTMPDGLFSHVPEHCDKLSPGGGFGPVADTGYGIAYSLPNDDMIQFHVTSKHSCKYTDTSRMIGNIFAALDDMKALFNKS